MHQFTLYDDLPLQVDIPKAGITSCPVYKSDHLRAVIFGFATGEEMTEHTASVPAIAQILEGECTFTFKKEVKALKQGAWVYMDAHLPHSVTAHTPLKLMLYLLREPNR